MASFTASRNPGADRCWLEILLVLLSEIQVLIDSEPKTVGPEKSC